MSRQQIFGVVGAVIGAFTPVGPQGGYVIGSAIGALTAPTQRIEGPRIETTPITGAAEGDPIPYVIVNGRVGGCIAWCSPKRPVPHTTEQGKGGGVESTTYTSEWDMLIIVDGHRTAGVRRIWRLGKLVWSIADGADSQTLADSATTDAWRRMTIYTGGNEQMPDPVYEAFHGVGNVSAHRNVTSVFIEGYQSDFGGQYIPLSFEVVEDGDRVEADEIITPAFNIQGDETFNFVGIGAPAVGGRPYLAYAAQPDSPEDPNPYRSYSIAANGSVGGYTETILPITVLSNSGALHGSTDASSLILRTSTTNQFYAIFTGLLPFYFQRPGFTPQGGTIFCKRGSLLVVSDDQVTFPARIDAFNTSGTFLASSTTLSDNPRWLAINSTQVFAVLTSGDVVVLNKGTLAIEETLATPVGSPDTPMIFVDDAGSLFWWDAARTGSVYQWDGAAWGVFYNEIAYAGGSRPVSVSIDGGYIYRAIASGRTLQVRRFGGGLNVNQRALADVVTQLTENTALLTANDIDVTDVDDIMVRGMVINQPTSTRAAIEKLLDVYLVEPYEDDRIVYRKRGGDPAVTIPYRDLGASEGGEFPEPLPIGLRNDIEVPARIRGKFGNVFNDFQVGLTPEGDRLTTDSLETRIVDLGVQLTPLEAARVIDVKTAELTLERRSLGPIVVTRKYAALRPTDVVLVENHDGSTYRARIAKVTDSGLLRTLELRPDDASTINPASEVENTDYSQTIVRNNVVTEIEALDTPAFRDADLGPGHYERIGAVGRWDGARFQVSQDDVNWSDVDMVNRRATYGTAASVLADFGGGNVFDEASSLTVNVTSGEFTSATAADLIASRTRNLIVVGAQGREEALQYRTATPLDASTVRLSGLLRGRFGTEHAMASHQIGDHVVLIQPAGIVRVDSDISAIGATRYYRAISFGKLVSSANVETFVNGGVSLRPYSAANPRVVRDASGNATLSCDRRTRATGRLFGPMGSSFPLGETAESWLWEIYSDGTYTTVLRELTSSVSEVAYSAADQSTDFGSPQSVINARVYQLSESIGRGYPLEIAA